MSEFCHEIRKCPDISCDIIPLIIPITSRWLPVNGGENVNLIIVLLLHCSAEIGLVWSVLLGPV